MHALLAISFLALALGGPVGAGAQDRGNANGGSAKHSAGADAAASERWQQLPPVKQAALAPLASEWDKLDEAHRRKWQALARNFDRMAPEEQQTLHSRMAEWAALSPRERVRARLNFAEVQRLAPSDQRKAQWDAYRALSDEERKALADQATKLPRGTALPVRPVPQGRLAPVPASAYQSSYGGPRIALTPPQAQQAAPSSHPRATPAVDTSPGAGQATPAMAPAAPAAVTVLPAGSDAPASVLESAPPDLSTPQSPIAP